MFKDLLPLGRDEVLAVLLAIASLFFAPIVIAASTTLNIVGSLALIYLIVCVIMRKYELIVRKYHHPIVNLDETSTRK